MSSAVTSPQGTVFVGNFSLQEMAHHLKISPTFFQYEMIMPSFRGRIPLALLEKIHLIFTNVASLSKADLEALKNFSAKCIKVDQAMVTIEITSTQEEEKVKSSEENAPAVLPSGKQWMPSRVPTDVLLNVFTFLDLESLVTLRRANKTFGAFRPQVQQTAIAGSLTYVETMKLSLIEEALRFRGSASWDDLVTLRKVGLLGPKSSAEQETWAKTGRSLPCLSRLTTISLDGVGLVDDAFLNYLRMICPNVSSIEIALNEKITEEGLKAICTWPLLEKLWISVVKKNFEQVTNLSHLSLCLNLKKLDLNLSNSPPNRGFGAAIAKGCSNLRSFRLKFPGMMNKKECLAIARGCSQLEEIEITSPMKKLTGSFLRELGKGCPKLRVAIFKGSLKAGPQDFEAFAASCNKLEVLILNGAELKRNWSRPLLEARLPLTKLDLDSQYELSSESIQKISHSITTLRELNLGGCSQVDDESLSAIASSCKSLRKIDLSGNSITDTGLRVLTASCPNLTDINLYGCEAITREGTKDLFKCCPELNTLAYNAYTNNILSVVTDDTRLTSINLNESPGITEEELITLIEKSPRLTSLNLTGCIDVNDRVLFAIAKSCPNLQELNLSNCIEVSPLGILSLEHCSQLKTLKIPGTNCSSESYAWLSAIGRLTTLERIEMEVCLTPKIKMNRFLLAGLSELSKCHKLISLSMHRTMLEKTELLQIAKAFPKLRNLNFGLGSNGIEAEIASLYPKLKLVSW